MFHGELMYFNKDVEKKVEWSQRSKKYKTKYFDALKQLYGAATNDKDAIEATQTAGETRTDKVRSVA
jgi:hypothetical protein